MKHLKTFEQFSQEFDVDQIENEALFTKDDKNAREAKSVEFDEVNTKIVGTKGDQVKNKEKWLDRARDQDMYKGDFVIDRGVLQYKSKSSNPFQGKTGGSSGFGTANG